MSLFSCEGDFNCKILLSFINGDIYFQERRVRGCKCAMYMLEGLNYSGGMSKVGL